MKAMSPNPAPTGDIGRRLALRREELSLTREQVAERAGIAPGYLQYVEEQPSAVPGLTFLLRVAEALETTVPRLRGAETGLPPGLGEAAEHPAFTVVEPEECLALLSDHGVGRIALTTDEGPAIVPVNYDMVDGAVVFRTAPPSVPSRAAGQEVAFEVDRIDEALSEGWSVLVLGAAAEVTDPADILDLQERARTTPWAGGDRPVWMRIDPVRITGRRITAG
ncbi:HTH cro/C1-type domain-containing protein [Actinacidiphila bryophytorum]|uniref:HTH cro/C1-type domain-containing protein n=2 Tax=Actinacidiphila bryophytorum TaxID=1436133 RepID=A0A9W4H2Y4_9ACTN|nr:HTH cro/C1-type domain-containing protein [Actinacidiphila bryophytorum]